MNLPTFSTRNSLLVNLISVLIIIAGIITTAKLQRDAFPPVDFDIVMVTTAYPGSPAEDVEKFVTIPIEKELKGVSGIKEMKSSTDEGASLISMTIDPGVRDKDQVVADIKDAVDRVRNLPAGVEDDPLVNALKSRERPIMEISISGDYPEGVKRQYAEALEDRLLDIIGVASIRRFGWRDREFWVEVDPQKLKEYYVSMDEIVNALRARNVTLPGGNLTTSSVEYNVRITGEFTNAVEIGNVVIRANDYGNWLKIKDVARVSDTFEEETRIAKINKHRAVAMVVVKSEYSDVIRVTDKVKEVIEEFKSDIPEGMEITTANDFAYYVKRRLGVVKNNGIIGLILVLLLLFLFLDPAPAIVTALGIPIALFITFMVMNVLGMTINLVSMLGLIIVLGMLVDDGIIVTENVYRYIEKGVSPREAAVKGTTEVLAPVTVTILTTCAVFAPLLTMKDILGKFIKELPLVVMIALIASLFEAFLILPSHLADFVKIRKTGPDGKPNHRSHRRWFQGLVSIYDRFLGFALKHRYFIVLGIFVPLLVLSIYIWKFHMEKVLFTNEGIEQFFVRIEAEKGTPLTKVNDLIGPLEDHVAALPSTELDSFRTYIGSIETARMFDPNARKGSHLGQITVFLTPFQTRQRTTREISDSIRERFKEIKGLEKIYIFQPKPGPPVGNAVEVAVKGEDFEVLQEIAAKFVKKLETIPGVSDIETSYDFGKKQLKVRVDEERAQQYYLDVNKIASSVRRAFRGGVATTVKPRKAEEEIDVVVRFAEEQQKDISAFNNILIPNRFDKLVPLNSVARVEEEEGAFLVTHLDGKRVIYVSAEVDNKQANSLSVNETLQKEFAHIPQDYLGYSIKYGGEFEKRKESGQNMMFAYGLALCIIFIILTAMFKSMLQPFIVMMAIPFGLIGVVLAFLVHGWPLGFFGLMGVVGLSGVVVNDSVVLVDFINRLRKSGKTRYESLREAGRIRLRPVIMTTVTTIGGLVSVAYGIGGGDPFLKPMALAIVWGLFFATVLTLVVIPCIYAIVDDLSELLFHHSTVK